ncbi:DUF2442 domain-containing protein [Myxococcota bacterium]|nr:DUF2442 domain-containing protein [Myxococcota bacterium]
MSSSAADLAPRAVRVDCSNEELTVALSDGRRLSVPLAWFPRLLEAPPGARAHYELLGGGIGIHWPEIDEDLSVEGLLRGTRAPGGRSRGA